MKILIISHGDFAAGMCSTLRTFFGADNVYSACVTPEGGTNDMMEVARRYLEEWGEEQVVICSDLKCGSANQTAYPDCPPQYIFGCRGESERAAAAADGGSCDR